MSALLGACTCRLTNINSPQYLLVQEVAALECGGDPQAICLVCDADRERQVVRPVASQCRAHRQPVRCQKRPLTEIETYNVYNSI